MSSAYEELIVQRDAIITDLQGEWPVDTQAGAPNVCAFKAAIQMFVSVMILFAMAMAMVVLTGQFDSEDGSMDLGGVVPVFLGFAAFFGVVIYVLVLSLLIKHRKQGPLVITGSDLVWAKRKGFVPERMGLCRVTQVITAGAHFGTVGMPSHRLVAWFMGLFGGSLRLVLNQYMFYSQGDNNTPKFSPAVFEDGDRLVNSIKELAAINTKINELNAAKEPAA